MFSSFQITDVADRLTVLTRSDRTFKLVWSIINVHEDSDNTGGYVTERKMFDNLVNVATVVILVSRMNANCYNMNISPSTIASSDIFRDLDSYFRNASCDYKLHSSYWNKSEEFKTEVERKINSTRLNPVDTPTCAAYLYLGETYMAPYLVTILSRMANAKIPAIVQPVGTPNQLRGDEWFNLYTWPVINMKAAATANNCSAGWSLLADRIWARPCYPKCARITDHGKWQRSVWSKVKAVRAVVMRAYMGTDQDFADYIDGEVPVLTQMTEQLNKTTGGDQRAAYIVQMRFISFIITELLRTQIATDPVIVGLVELVAMYPGEVCQENPATFQPNTDWMTSMDTVRTGFLGSMLTRKEDTFNLAYCIVRDIDTYFHNKLE
jgi:hypothetical protein